MRRVLPLTVVSHFVIGYLLLAFGWWAFLMWRQNERLFVLEKQAVETRFSKKNQGANLTQIAETSEYKAALKKWKTGRRMVVSEGLFFVVCLIFGVYMIRRSADREVSLARQRRNFMLSITHELKSPIAAIRLTLETLCKRELNREQLEKLCANGLKDSARLQSLVEDLLLAARLEDNWKPHPEHIDLPALARDCAEGLKVRFPHANIRLDVSDGLPDISADKSGLSSVIQNLLENAVKYAPEGSEVILKAEKTNGKLHISVADLGPGIPDSEKQAVFEKFYRLGNEETRRATGTGLGLYIVQQVVRAHGGNIRIGDNKPNGTVFNIEL
jgi:two-component system, OmpR family, phosphate regulon sensor histidine kinase PhoR